MSDDVTAVVAARAGFTAGLLSIRASTRDPGADEAKRAEAAARRDRDARIYDQRFSRRPPVKRPRPKPRAASRYTQPGDLTRADVLRVYNDEYLRPADAIHVVTSASSASRSSCWGRMKSSSAASMALSSCGLSRFATGGRPTRWSHCRHRERREPLFTRNPAGVVFTGWVMTVVDPSSKVIAFRLPTEDVARVDRMVRAYGGDRAAVLRDLVMSRVEEFDAAVRAVERGKVDGE